MVSILKIRVILGKGREGVGWRRGERPNILNIVAWINYLATFDCRQLATLYEIGNSSNATSFTLFSSMQNA